MKETTLENMKAAFAGESQAHMKYMAFAERAEREGFANIARLFRAASFSPDRARIMAWITRTKGSSPADDRAFPISARASGSSPAP